jgi:DNA polymerase-1
LPLITIEGVEADDVIGTLAAAAAAQGMDTLISTGDKDLAQLVNGHITLINTMTNTVLDRKGVMEKFGITPEQISDYLVLVGDAVDNVPGVPKVGPVTALKWLKQYGTLDNIVAHAHEISGKAGENLRAALPQLPLYKQVLTIKRDVPLPIAPQDLQPRAPDVAALRRLYQRLEFRRWLAELDEDAKVTPSPLGGEPHLTPSPLGGEGRGEGAPVTFETPTSINELQNWITAQRGVTALTLALETSGTDYMRDDLTGLAVRTETGAACLRLLARCAQASANTHRQAWYVLFSDTLPRDAVLDALRPLLQNPAVEKRGHDLKFALNVLARHGITPEALAYDVMLESYVLDSTAARHNLASLCEKYLERELASPASAAEQVTAISDLHRRLWPKLEEIPPLKRLFSGIEMPLIPVLARMERAGVLVDAAALRAHSRELGARLKQLEEQAYQMAGRMFNLNSPQQLQDVLYDKLGLPVLKKTPKGQPSTAEEVLQELALDYPLPGLILEQRTLSKLKSTYTDRLPEQTAPATGRVHTRYHQAVTATGRLSSSDPNLQNIPVRGEEGKRVRAAFIAPTGYRLLSADYSQIELRIMAHLSGDARLKRAFEGGQDIHQATAAEVFGVKLEQVSEEQRRAAKVINFGLIYGMSAFGLAKQLGVPREAAQEYMNLYFARYPGVHDFMERTRAQARRLGYVETLYGRRLYLPEINSRNAQRRQYAERTAINAPMQGSAADIIKLAMLRIDAWLQQTKLNARMIMQVHDELVFEVEEKECVTLTENVRRLMTAIEGLSVPLTVDVGTGRNWAEAH